MPSFWVLGAFVSGVLPMLSITHLFVIYSCFKQARGSVAKFGGAGFSQSRSTRLNASFFFMLESPRPKIWGAAAPLPPSSHAPGSRTLFSNSVFEMLKDSSQCNLITFACSSKHSLIPGVLKIFFNILATNLAKTVRKSSITPSKQTKKLKTELAMISVRA